jgi:hypothetical protein
MIVFVVCRQKLFLNLIVNYEFGCSSNLRMTINVTIDLKIA